MSALTGRSPSSVRAIRPIRTAPAVWELDGPTMIGPRISKMSSISIPPVFFCYDGSICPLFLQAASCGKLSAGRPRGRPSRLRRKTDSVPSKAVMIPVLQKPASAPPFVIQLSSLDSKTTVSTVVSVSKGSSFTSSPSTGTGKLNTIFFIQLPSFLFSGNISIRSIKAFINSFCSASVAEW